MNDSANDKIVDSQSTGDTQNQEIDDACEDFSAVEMETAEQRKLGGKPPLRTIISLCGGPLISQFTSAMYGLANSMWVSKYVGTLGLAVMSSSYVIENTILSCGYFANVAASTKIAYLISLNDYDGASQVCADLIRVCGIIGILLPAIFLPLVKPFVQWISETSEYNEEAFLYLLPLLVCSSTACLYLCVCGILQAEGRTWWYGLAQICSLVTNMIVFNPLFLSQIKRAWGSSLSTVLAEAIPALIILFLLLRGKLSCEPKLKMFIKPFHRETYSALKTGFSSFIMNLSVTIPSIFVQKYAAIAAENVNATEDVLAVWNALCRIYNICLGVPLALNTAFLPAASYAYGRELYRRILWLLFHVLWMSVLWALFITFLCCTFPGDIAKIWSSTSSFIYWSKIIIPINFYTIAFSSCKFVMISFLQATYQPIKASITSFLTELLPIPIFSTIFHFTGDKTHPERPFYAYIVSDTLACTCSTCVVLPSLIKYYKHKSQNQS